MKFPVVHAVSLHYITIQYIALDSCNVLLLFIVFHQADGAGNPVMDLGHVITCLNKLDASEEEKIVLSSRDGKSLMVVTYADVARCLEAAYHELCSGSVRQLPARGGY
mmetsp:Transcript_5036/g.12016  ORF Transcript_5036/g.12016 Transcript_5036/m.12016 type:complete len:108 (+) Transcript_5036:1576-1899(+)